MKRLTSLILTACFLVAQHIPAEGIPEGPQIRIIPLASPLKTEDGFAQWMQPEYAAEDILDMIEGLKPQVLERYITGAQNPDAPVPVREGNPPMTVKEFLNASLDAGAPGCIIIPKLNLTWISWGRENYFWKAAENNFNLPLKRPIRIVNLDNWNGFIQKHGEKKAREVLQRLKDIGFEQIGVNMAGGYKEGYGYLSFANFLINSQTWEIRTSTLNKLKTDPHINQYYLYIDYPGQMDEFMKLTEKQQADVFTCVIRKGQEQEGFTFVYPVLFDKWDATKHHTPKNGKYKGATLYEVIQKEINRSRPRPLTPQNPTNAVSREADHNAPNIILFLADDMGQGDTSAYQTFTEVSNDSQLHTPAMERLAERGIRFTDGHSGAAVCHPSRMALMRGGQPERRQSDFGTHALPAMLRRAGYTTYGIGKWHVWYRNGTAAEFNIEGSDYHYDSPPAYGPLDMGFDHYTGTEDNITHSPAFIVDRHYMKYDPATKSLQPNRSKIPPGYGNPGGPVENICQQIWIDAARAYINTHASGGTHAGKPFFLYYASHANHKQYLPATDIDGITVKGNCKVTSGKVLSTNEFTAVKHDKTGGGSTYLNNGLILERSEMVWENDVALSLLMDWLDNTDDPRNPGHKMADNTLLIFTADNGSNIDRKDEETAPHPNHGKLRGRKGDIWEGGHRVPFIASWPGQIPKNASSDAQISLMDLYATFAEIAGEPLLSDEALHSFSALNALKNPDLADYRPTGIYAVDKVKRDENSLRDGKYKIIWHGSKKPTFVELYNLESDLGETRNLLGNPEYAEVETRLKQQAGIMISSGRMRTGQSE